MTHLLALLAASACGILSGLGVGGGSLLMLWLLYGVHLNFESAQVINLAAFISAALISVLYQLKKQSLPKCSLPAAIAGSISALAFSQISRAWDISLLRKILGLFFIAAGLREFFLSKRMHQ